MKEAINQFENEAQEALIRPKNIPDDRRIDSFTNFFNTIPIVDKKNEPEIIYFIYSDSGFEKLSQSDKSDKSIKSGSSKKRKPKRIIVPKQVKFGQNLKFSFFETFTREIIFQMFNYKKIYYFKYELKMKEQTEDSDKDSQKEIKTQIQILNEKKDAEKSPKEVDIKSPKEVDRKSPKEENKKSLEKEDEKSLKEENSMSPKKGNEMSPNLENEISPEKEDRKSPKEENKKCSKEEEEKSLEEKDRKSPKEENERTHDEEVGKSFKEENDLFPKDKENNLSKKDEIENMPINLNKNETIEEKKIEIEEEISKIEINKKKGDFMNQKSLKNLGQENANNNNNQKSFDKENKEFKIIKGDFDFLIPDISPQELLKGIKNKENASFIFYNNINFERISDIIGETKESLCDEKRPIEQIKKYIKLFNEFNNSEKICHSVGLKKDNQKILMYVFNSEYKDYLTKMLNYNAHKKLFKEVLDEYKGKSFYSSFRNELANNKKDFKEDIPDLIKDKEMPKNKVTLIDQLVDSKLPYLMK